MTTPTLSIPRAALWAAIMCTAGAAPAAQTPADSPVLAERHESPQQHDARMAWWREAKFGMFIHWGLYAQAGGMWQGKEVPGGYKEWIMHNGKISIADYATLAKDFNPVNYDADQWVLAAKNAGMKYMVITAKHHDGFAMFKSAASPFNMVDATPFGRDPLKELAAACRKHGMKLGFYYSHNYDWHHPGGGMGDWDTAHKGDTDKYVNEIVIPQLRELLTNYGDIAILWFDMGGGSISREGLERIQQAVLACNPNIIVNDRLGGDFHGDTETPEQSIPARVAPGRDWETCMTMNGTWGYGKNDHNWKHTPDLIRNLCLVASKGGNYLLNVGPNELGEIPAASLERLAQVGAWIKTNGAAIYGTAASPFPHRLPWGCITARSNLLYLCVNQLPADRKLTLPELTTKIAHAYFLADANKRPLEIVTADTGIPTLVVPDPAPVAFGAYPTMIVAELQGGPMPTLLRFVFPGMPPATLSGKDIRVQVPLATDLTKLAPTYNTGSSLVTGQPASGVANNFITPQTYTITAPDGMTKAYVVTVTPTLGAVGVGNPSFEEFDILDQYDETIGQVPTGATWSFNQVNKGGTEIGICHINGPIHAPPAPDGTWHCGFIRGATNNIAQTINFDQGRYTVSFNAVKRAGYSPVANPLTVSVDGVPVLTVEPARISEVWGTYTSPPFTVTAGPHTLAFVLGVGDGMDLIDNVVLTYVKY